jgi:hypothetical protein
MQYYTGASYCNKHSAYYYYHHHYNYSFIQHNLGTKLVLLIFQSLMYIWFSYCNKHSHYYYHHHYYYSFIQHNSGTKLVLLIF